VTVALELVDLDRAVGGVLVHVVDVEATRVRVIGREGDREQAALAGGVDPVGDVQERLRGRDRVVERLDETGPLGHEEQGREGWGVVDVGGRVEGPDGVELDA
jgi:hypothetical protein